MDAAEWGLLWWDFCRRGVSNAQSKGNRVDFPSGGVSAGPNLFRVQGPERTGRGISRRPDDRASPHHAGISKEVL